MPHMEGIFINGEKAKFHPEDILEGVKDAYDFVRIKATYDEVGIVAEKNKTEIEAIAAEGSIPLITVENYDTRTVHKVLYYVGTLDDEVAFATGYVHEGVSDFSIYYVGDDGRVDPPDASDYSGAMVINDTDGLLDRTWQEIYDAMAQGKTCIVRSTTSTPDNVLTIETVISEYRYGGGVYEVKAGTITYRVYSADEFPNAIVASADGNKTT